MARRGIEPLRRGSGRLSTLKTQKELHWARGVMRNSRATRTFQESTAGATAPAMRSQTAGWEGTGNASRSAEREGRRGGTHTASVASLSSI